MGTDRQVKDKAVSTDQIKEAMDLLAVMGYQSSTAYEALVELLPADQQPVRDEDYTITVLITHPAATDISRTTMTKIAHGIRDNWQPITVKQGKCEITARPNVLTANDLYW